MTFKINIFIAFYFLISATVLAGEGDPARGEESYKTCASCHGNKGEGNVDRKAPKLQGQHGWYLVQQLKNFMNGVRGTHADDAHGKEMRSMAMMTLTDDQAIEDVVAYINTLE